MAGDQHMATSRKASGRGQKRGSKTERSKRGASDRGLSGKLESSRADHLLQNAAAAYKMGNSEAVGAVDHN